MKILLFLFLISANVFAFKFSPMSITINPLEGERSGQVFLENDSSAPIAIQMTLAKRIMDKKGIETYPEELEELQAYPTQLIIPPFEKRSVKITFTGKELGESEKAFRIIAEQLPIEIEKTKKKKLNVKLLLRYIGALYIDNGKTESNVAVEKFNVGQKTFQFQIKNNGNKHQVLTNLNLVFNKAKEKEIIVTSKDLKNFSGENILAHSQREFEVAVIPAMQKITNDYSVELKYEKDK